MSNKTDKSLDLQAKRDLGALEGFLHILAEQVLVLHDNLPDMETVDSEKLEEVQRELLAIARSVRMASTMADTAHNDYKTLLERAYAPVRPTWASGAVHHTSPAAEASSHTRAPSRSVGMKRSRQ